MADITMDLEKTSRLRSLNMIDTWWQEGNTPTTSTSASVSSLYRTGDPNALSNYRPIALLNTAPSNCFCHERRSRRIGDQCLFHRHLGAHKGPIWANLGPFLVPLGRCWINVGTMLDPFGPHSGPVAVAKSSIEKGVGLFLQPKTQYGFRTSRSTTQALYIARRLQECSLGRPPGTQLISSCVPLALNCAKVWQ
jgi:hypothetical protein